MLTSGRLSIVYRGDISFFVFSEKRPTWKVTMEYDDDKIDQTVLALLYLTLHDVDEYGARAWKGHDWEVLNRLHEKGWISNPKSKAKSVYLTPEAVKESERLFDEFFGK